MINTINKNTKTEMKREIKTKARMTSIVQEFSTRRLGKLKNGG